jgi:uncharacterized protein involved in response to NO
MIRRISRLFAAPFRVFFFLAGLYSIVIMGLWLPVYVGAMALPERFGPALWHGHEMIFGYTGAVLAGFLLTAVANWTGVPAWTGRPLAWLGGVWLAGRVAVTCGDSWPGWLVALVDLAYLPALAVMVALPVLKTGNRRQLVFLVLLAGLTAANLMVHLEAMGVLAGGGRRGLVLAVTLVVAIIAVMGGRIIPMFTANALRQRGDLVAPKVRPWVERLALPVLIGLAGAELFDETGPAAALAALSAALIHGVRLSGWRGHRTLDQPILWVLHLGYGWLVFGLLLKGLAPLLPDQPPNLALHALTVGAIGTLSLGVMTRVALGHTGRPFQVAPVVVAGYALITAAALVRVAGPWLMAGGGVPVMHAAGGLWAAAFAAFLAGYAGILTSPRVDGRPG